MTIIRFAPSAALLLAAALVLPAPARPQAPAAAAPAAANTAAAHAAGLLPPAEVEKLIPPSVFFQGQSATVQLRNAGAVRFPDGAIMFAVKVDTGGYSTSVQERYQDYLVTETPLQLGSGASARTLPPGAYGIGFTATAGLLVMDIGGHSLFTLPTQMDPSLHRPTPLQVIADGPGFRLYSGRAYIPFTAAAPAQQAP